MKASIQRYVVIKESRPTQSSPTTRKYAHSYNAETAKTEAISATTTFVALHRKTLLLDSFVTHDARIKIRNARLPQQTKTGY